MLRGSDLSVIDEDSKIFKFSPQVMTVNAVPDRQAGEGGGGLDTWPAASKRGSVMPGGPKAGSIMNVSMVSAAVGQSTLPAIPFSGGNRHRGKKTSSSGGGSGGGGTGAAAGARLEGDSEFGRDLREGSEGASGIAEDGTESAVGRPGDGVQRPSTAQDPPSEKASMKSKLPVKSSSSRLARRMRTPDTARQTTAASRFSSKRSTMDVGQG